MALPGLGRSCELQVTEGDCGRADLVDLAERESMRQNHTCQLTCAKECRRAGWGGEMREKSRMLDLESTLEEQLCQDSHLQMQKARLRDGERCVRSHSRRSRVGSHSLRHLSQGSFYYEIGFSVPL